MWPGNWSNRGVAYVNLSQWDKAFDDWEELNRFRVEAAQLIEITKNEP